MSLNETEAECAAVAVAPRVSLADIEGAIMSRYDVTGTEAVSACYVAADPGQLAVLSLCILVMRNGFVVIGHSAPASPQNFNRELGIKLAYENAVRQLWPLMGFALRDTLYRKESEVADYASRLANSPPPGCDRPTLPAARDIEYK